MSELLLKFGKNEIIKKSFCKSMSPINVNKVDVNKIIMSNKVSYDKKGCKYFIGYKDNNNIVRPLHIF